MPKQFIQIPVGTRLGKWSLALVGLMIAGFFLGMNTANLLYGSVLATDTIFTDLAARPVLALSMLLGMLAGISAFLTGLLAIFKKEERSAFVYLSTAIGAMLILFLIGEFLTPH